MQNVYEIAREIRVEVEEILDRYQRGKGPNGFPIDRSDERYVVEDAIKSIIEREIGRFMWTQK